MALSERPARAFEKFRGTFATHSSKRGVVRIWWPAPTLMATEVEGHLDASAARFLATSLREHAVTLARIVGFHDWKGLSDYDSEARILLTGVARESLACSEGTHVLASSALVVFGLRAANVILGNVHGYSERAAFDAALASALRKLEQ